MTARAKSFLAALRYKAENFRGFWEKLSPAGETDYEKSKDGIVHQGIHGRTV